MGDLKISQFATGDPVQATDQVLVARGGTNVRVSARTIGAAPAADYMLGAGGFQTAISTSTLNVGVHTDLNSRVYFHRFNTSLALNFTKCSFTAGSNLGGGGNVNFGLYSDTGNLLFTTGAQSVPNSSNTDVDLALSPAWATVPGVYILAWAMSDIHVTAWGWDIEQVINNNSAANSWNLLNRNGVVNFGYAANLATTGAVLMPATLGALTAAVAGVNNTYTPAVLFQK